MEQEQDEPLNSEDESTSSSSQVRLNESSSSVIELDNFNPSSRSQLRESRLESVDSIDMEVTDDQADMDHDEVDQDHDEFQGMDQDDDVGDGVGESLHEAELRYATSKYLKGELSLPEYAAALNMFNQKEEGLKSVSASTALNVENDETKGVDVDEAEDGSTANQFFEEEYVDNEGNVIRVETTDITNSLFTYISKGTTGDDEGSSKDEEISSGIRAGSSGFYSSGTEAKSFSVRRKRKLPPTLQNMIGQSHLSYAKGDWATAIDICLEIIKEQPTCVEPFHTLSMIYENQGRMDKSLQYALVAGLLDPKRCEEWPKLAELSVQENNFQQAIMCYSHAIILNPRNPQYQLKRCELFEKVNDFKSALKGYQKILLAFPEEGKLCVEVLRKNAAIQHDAENLESSFQSLEIAFKNYSEHITSEEINLMLELCIAQKKYVEAFKILTEHCHVKFLPALDPDKIQDRESLMNELKDPKVQCITPIVFNIDLIAKLVIVLVHLGAFHMSDRLVEMIHEYDVNEFGDIYFDIAEAYMARQNNQFALNLLTPLVNSENYSMAAVWLRFAESLFLVDRLEEAAEAYEKVIALAPAHNLAKLNLSIILQRLGRSEDALEKLGNERTEEDLIDPELLMERCHILYDSGRIQEFVEKSLNLFGRHFPRITSNEDCQVIILISNRCKRYEALKLDRRLRGQAVPPDRDPNFLDKETDITSEWKLYLKLCHTLVNLERFDLLARVTHSAMSSKLFGEYPRTEREAEIHCLCSSILSSDSQDLAPYYIRLFMSSFGKNPTMLNLFGLAVRKGHAKRYGRYLLRLLKKYPDNDNLLLLRAHISFFCGSYKNAISEYSTLFRQNPKNPLVLLMMASVYLHLMVQKANPFNRARLSMIIIGLVGRYAQLRGECQESYYNAARAYQLLGFNNLAILYYNKVLDTVPAIHERKLKQHVMSGDGKIMDNCFVSDDTNILNLQCEAAFNLSQIYRSTGQEELARYYIMTYIVI